MILSDNQRVSQSKEQASCIINDETVLLDIESGSYFSLNITGNSIWSLIEEPITFADLCHKLQKEYNVSIEECRSNVSELLNELLEKRLIELHD